MNQKMRPSMIALALIGMATAAAAAYAGDKPSVDEKKVDACTRDFSTCAKGALGNIKRTQQCAATYKACKGDSTASSSEKSAIEKEEKKPAGDQQADSCKRDLGTCTRSAVGNLARVQRCAATYKACKGGSTASSSEKPAIEKEDEKKTAGDSCKKDLSTCTKAAAGSLARIQQCGLTYKVCNGDSGSADEGGCKKAARQCVLSAGRNPKQILTCAVQSYACSKGTASPRDASWESALQTGDN